MKCTFAACVFICITLVAKTTFADFHIAYIPLSFNYYSPPNEKNLEQKYAHFIFDIKSEKISSLFKELEKVQGEKRKANHLRIRVVDNDSKKEIFIQKDKTIFKNGTTYTPSTSLIDECIREIELETKKHKATSDVLQKIHEIEVDKKQ